MPSPAPEDPLAAARAAFEAGDYGEARALAGEHLASADARVREAARRLVERTTPDPAAKWLLLGALVVIAATTAYWLAHPSH